jgi:hypothetical protein
MSARRQSFSFISKAVRTDLRSALAPRIACWPKSIHTKSAIPYPANSNWRPPTPVPARAAMKPRWNAATKLDSPRFRPTAGGRFRRGLNAPNSIAVPFRMQPPCRYRGEPLLVNDAVYSRPLAGVKRIDKQSMDANSRILPNLKKESRQSLADNLRFKFSFSLQPRARDHRATGWRSHIITLPRLSQKQNRRAPKGRAGTIEWRSHSITCPCRPCRRRGRRASELPSSPESP